MRNIKGLLIALAIVVLSATSFKCIAQASQLPNFNNHKEYVGTVLRNMSAQFWRFQLQDPWLR